MTDKSADTQLSASELWVSALMCVDKTGVNYIDGRQTELIVISR